MTRSSFTPTPAPASRWTQGTAGAVPRVGLSHAFDAELVLVRWRRYLAGFPTQWARLARCHLPAAKKCCHHDLLEGRFAPRPSISRQGGSCRLASAFHSRNPTSEPVGM